MTRVKLNRKTHDLRGEIASERKLRHIVEITKKCNLFCVHCSARSGNADRELSLKEIKIILDKASLLGLKDVGFTGGYRVTSHTRNTLSEIAGPRIQ